jgi:ABC-type Fe3+-citrate transport system substrate-binding protein
LKASDAKKIDKLLAKNESAEKRIAEFEGILDSVEDLDEKKRFLWLEIYNNAKNDRVCASALFAQAFSQLGATSSEHVTLGPTLVKYLERMTKANDQLLSLAAIVTKDIEQKSAVDADDIFSKIEG